MKNIFKTVPLFLLIVGIISCGKDNNNTPEPPPKKILLSKITKQGAGYYTYEYNADGKMVKQVFYSSGSSTVPNTTWTFSYDATGRLATYVQDYANAGNTDNKYQIAYASNGNIDKITRNKITGELDRTIRFLYSAAMLTLETETVSGEKYKNEYILASGGVNTKEIKTYSYSSGSWVLEVHLKIDGHDEKKTALSFFPNGFFSMPQLVEFLTGMPSSNNPLHVTLGTDTGNFSYNYNTEGYPVHCTLSVPGEEDMTLTYEYAYQ